MNHCKYSLCHSTKWLQGRHKDWYARLAYNRRLRSRSWFKLDEINCMDKLLYAGISIVIDLGSTPGGWSLYAKNKIGKTGRVISCDITPMNNIIGVNFLKGDCSDPNVLKILLSWIGSEKAQIILSDMSPKMTGVSIIDINRSIFLGRLALNICHSTLISGGNFLVKVLQGSGFDQYICDVRSVFNIVKIRKPNASRSCSREVYIVGKEYQHSY